MNEQNLRPFTSETGKEGQRKSVESRRRNKTIRESMVAALEMPVTDPKQLEVIKKSGLPVPDKPTYKDFAVASALLRTIKGGKMTDIEVLMRIVGECNAPNNGNEISANMATLAEILRNPAPNRRIEDFEE